MGAIIVQFVILPVQIRQIALFALENRLIKRYNIQRKISDHNILRCLFFLYFGKMNCTKSVHFHKTHNRKAGCQSAACFAVNTNFPRGIRWSIKSFAARVFFMSEAFGNIKTFGIIGGDKRQLFLAQSLLEDGCGAILAGFGKLREHGFRALSGVEAAVLYSDAVILPLPSVRADRSINAPFSEKSIVLSEEQQALLCKKPVFAAMSDRLFRAYPMLKNASVYDYASRDDFAVLNAVPTAEGALELAMQEYEGTLWGSRSLVTGFGRIGKALARRLSSLGSSVTVCARKASDLAFIETLGYTAGDFSSLGDARGYDLIFNTVPAMVFDEALLRKTDKTALLFDLASLPGGVDFESAAALGIDARRALSLPGKCAPKAAGEIIKKTVFSIIKEGKR